MGNCVFSPLCKKVTGISESRKAKITPAMALENSIIFYKHM